VDSTTLRERLRAAHPDVDAAAMRVVRAPGRVNLIGEHTDYNEGFVLPAAIDLCAWMAFVRTTDRRVEVVLGDGLRDGFELDEIGGRRNGWIDRLAGMAWSLGQRGRSVRGLRAVLLSEIPIGAGLSSSAAVEVAMAWALLDERPPLPPMELAVAAQAAENDYVGVRSGLMDPFASACGQPGAAMLLDCRSQEYRTVPLPLDRYALVACDTRAPHRLEASEYNARRAQCEAAVKVVAQTHPEVRSLRDVSMTMLDGLTGLDDESHRRAEHVVKENERVVRTVDALQFGRMEEVGRLFADSHASLRDLYEVSSPELDALVEIASGTPGVVASRMTGAGFGGCTVNLVERDAVGGLREAIQREYPARTGRQPAVYAVEAAAGAGEVAA
jgi:galactokinase